MKKDSVLERRTVDIGLERFVMPRTTLLVSIAPQQLFRTDRLYVEECHGVTLDEVKIGNRSQHDSPVSTIFYSVPTTPKTIDRMRELIAKSRGVEPDWAALAFAWDDKADENAGLGQPVTWDTAEVGNLISMAFSNKGLDPVRLEIVLRGTSVR